MEWKYTATEPQPVETKMHLGQPRRTVNYAAEPTEIDGYAFRCKAVTLPAGVWNYDAIVDAIITAEYTGGRMQAIVNNYLADPADADARAEMDAMQADRARAKAVARAALAYVEQSNTPTDATPQAGV